MAVGSVSRKARSSFAIRVRLGRTGSYRLLVSAGSTGQATSARPIAVRVGGQSGGLPAA